MGYVLITFKSPHHTIKADKILQQASIKSMIYPVPREISKDCGMGIRIFDLDLAKAKELFRSKKILYRHIVPLTGESLVDKVTTKDQ